MDSNFLDSNTVWNQHSLFLKFFILGALKLGEPPFGAWAYTLLAWELMLGAGQCSHSELGEVVLGADTEDWVTDLDTGDLAEGLTEGVTHTSL